MTAKRECDQAMVQLMRLVDRSGYAALTRFHSFVVIIADWFGDRNENVLFHVKETKWKLKKKKTMKEKHKPTTVCTAHSTR